MDMDTKQPRTVEPAWRMGTCIMCGWNAEEQDAKVRNPQEQWRELQKHWKEEHGKELSDLKALDRLDRERWDEFEGGRLQ
jgi:hypothetical protein